MIYITICPKCEETISFLENEDVKICKNCGESVINKSKNKEKTKKERPRFDKINLKNKEV